MVAISSLNKKMLIFCPFYKNLFAFKVILHRCNHLTVRVKIHFLRYLKKHLKKGAFIRV